ncbi:glycosyltransferase family 2 protein [Leptospira borgpetersenii]|uniref:Glycosyltransferase-like protein, family 2 n=1 Tax=Leptospira borgpetersenii serovar Ballum TaxID=280505 RepID=A0A0E3B387_LEPBO|nr:glycosyltransferase family A protein [Leptospira borgpetersenii]EMO11517.1 glycosyltransferase-like protein, family 2 [Leptospira borgpetersenii str. Noumea 25]ALO25982.1 glycosyltransferase-like protein, family 2 [Leptospira borgpetersenii serovar Ballum]ANH00752.2 Glycosyltransferase-like protein, family 2 [Leptospira borgpetersenii str. 4E]KGE24411.1 glycosyl transferase [Leptospira borgpetersenii serovar Ballum]MBE8159799.1 glycosyltransferase family 2 protein [Leptospira borgpetersenii
MNPLVSIVIPCYNYGRYIHETVESILRQRYKYWEVIIVDDGSSDPFTISILEEYKNKSGFTVLSIPRSGPSTARNIGIDTAQGEFILPLDSDDMIHEDYLLEAISAYEKNPSLGIVYCEAEFFGSIKGKWNLPEYRFPNILLDNCIFVSAVFKKSDWKEVGGFNENMKNEWEDYDFWLSLIEKGGKVYRIPKVLFYYRIGHSSRSQRSLKHFLPLYMQLYENHKELYLKNIQFLFQRHLEAKRLEDEFLILTKNPFVYSFIKMLITFLKYLSLIKRKFLNV